MQVADLLFTAHKGCYILLNLSTLRNAVKPYAFVFKSS